MRIIQKYARATTSSNLKCDDSHHDVDALMAVALCGVPLGPLLIRAKIGNEESAYRALQPAWLDVVAKTAFMKNWPEKIKVKVVAEKSLRHWMNDACPTCTGRKSDRIDNTPCLSGVDCVDCGGTGKRPVDCDQTHEPYVTRMVYALDTTIMNASCSAQEKDRKSD